MKCLVDLADTSTSSRVLYCLLKPDTADLITFFVANTLARKVDVISNQK